VLRLGAYGRSGRPAGPVTVSEGYLPVLGAALRHGPPIAGLCAFAVTPGSLIVIARVLERRWLVPREQFTAVVYGDPLLAVTVGLGVWLTGPRTPHGLTGPAAGLAVAVITLGFGLVQWRDELRRGYYTRAQAAAPTKIWHQLVVYPVLGYWLWTACLGGLAGPGEQAGKALMLALIGIWLATNVYDRRHPKLGHPPFDWRHGRPRALPWAAESQTLYAARLAAGDRGTPAASPCDVLPARRGGPGSSRGRAGPPVLRAGRAEDTSESPRVHPADDSTPQVRAIVTRNMEHGDRHQELRAVWRLVRAAP
jgi:hypothetical protein